EDVIQLSHYFKKDLAGITTKLYAHRNKYYLFIEFSYEMNDEVQENLISQLFEFGEDSNYTTYYLEEYGKVIFEQDVFTAVQSYFSMLSIRIMGAFFIYLYYIKRMFGIKITCKIQLYLNEQESPIFSRIDNNI